MADGFALGLGDAGRGRFFNYFLVAALHRAIALAQINGVAVLIGQHLDFHVARLLQIALHIHHRVAEGGTGFGFGHFHRFEQVFFFLDHAHAAAAATAGGFDNHRKAHLVGNAQDFGIIIGQSAFRAGHTRHAGCNHGVFGGNFVAHQADGVGARADKHKARLLHLVGKIGVFGQKAVAGVNGIGAGYFGGGNDGGNMQITLRRRRGADAHRFIGELHMQAVAVGFGMHGNGGDAHFAAGAQYAQSDFTAVGNQNFFQHKASFRMISDKVSDGLLCVGIKRPSERFIR